MRILKSEKCAWRGRYLHLSSGRQVARVVLDPYDGVRPTLSVAVGSREARIPMPRVPWSWCSRSNYNPLVCALYRASQRFWHRVDGRYR